jgi:broad specificity phosphatase PhoE
MKLEKELVALPRGEERSMRSPSFPWPYLLLALAWPGPAAAQKAVIVIRHAENVGDKLTEAGRARAERLTATLENAAVRAVYSTDSNRTIGTVTPLAEARKLPVLLYDTADASNVLDARPFVSRLREEHPDDVVLVVGHVTTIPDLLKALGCPGEITIAHLAYDDVFVVVPREKGSATLVRLKY